MLQIANLNFLVAEDNPFQRRTLVLMLASLGAKKIFEASDGQEALRYFRDRIERIDVALVDINMPSMDGLELIRHLGHEDYGVSVILVSAHERSLLFSAATMSKAYGVSLLGTIEKPATTDKLLELLKLYQPIDFFANSLTVAAPVFSFEEVVQGLKNKQFEPFFQPKVNLDTGRVEGAEAYARWRHPQHGIIPPASFIPVLEANGRVDVLSWIMIEKSVATCRSWHEQGFDIAVSINLSPLLLKESSFSEQIIERIAKQGVAPKYVTFEITESSAITTDPRFLENLARLHMKGFGLSIDDYGNGDTNIRQLALIPFSELKIDRSFVAGASQKEELSVVLRSCLELAKNLNRHSVAVGIETKQDWDFLHELGCTYAQGFYLAKPMEAAAFPGWLREWALFF